MRAPQYSGEDEDEVLPNFERIYLHDIISDTKVWEIYSYLEQKKVVSPKGWTGFAGYVIEEHADWFGSVWDLIAERIGSNRRFLTRYSRADVKGMGANSCVVDGDKEEYDPTDLLVLGVVSGEQPAGTETDFMNHKSTVETVRRRNLHQFFTYSFWLYGDEMQVMRSYGRMQLKSSRFNVNQDPLRLIRTLGCFMRMEKSQLGFDSTLRSVDGQLQLTIGKKLDKETLYIAEYMQFPRKVELGEETIIYSAHNYRSQFLVKDTWETDLDRGEGERMLKAQSAGVDKLFTYYRHEMIVDDKWGESAPSFGRHRVRIVFKLQPFKYLHETGSAALTLKGFRDCLVAHRELYEIGILHRDITARTTLFNTNSREPQEGFLSDLQHAIDLSDGRPASAFDKCGIHMGVENLKFAELLSFHISTWTYRASVAKPEKDAETVLLRLKQLQEKKRDQQPHTYLDDLESFFWLIFRICAFYDDAGNPVGSNQVKHWDQKIERHELSGEKIRILASQEYCLGVLKDVVMHSYPRSLIPCVLDLRELFHDTDYAANQFIGYISDGEEETYTDDSDEESEYDSDAIDFPEWRKRPTEDRQKDWKDWLDSLVIDRREGRDADALYQSMLTVIDKHIKRIRREV